MKILNIKWITAGLGAVFMTCSSFVLFATVGLLVFVTFCHFDGHLVGPVVLCVAGLLGIWTGIGSFNATLRYYNRNKQDGSKSKHTQISSKFIPSERFRIETSLSIEAIVDILNSNVEPKKMFHTSTNHAPFQGTISQVGFKITRIIDYRNSFSPIVTGKFMPSPNGTNISIRMKLHPFVIIFIRIWFGFVGFGCVVFLLRLLSGNNLLHPASLIPFGMLIFGWVLVSKLFWFEARKQKILLKEMFDKL